MIYDYKCSACDHVFEANLKMADMHKPEGEPCPECDKAGSIRKVILSTIPVIDPVNAGRIKVNSDLRNKLQQIKDTYKGSKINPYGFDR